MPNASNSSPVTRSTHAENHPHVSTASRANGKECLSAEDKMILYAALQQLANELRRITRKEENHAQGK